MENPTEASTRKKLNDPALEKEGVKSGLNFDDVRGLSVFKPPIHLQKEFENIVSRYKNLQAQQREALRQAEHLFQSLLKRAFHGEL